MLTLKQVTITFVSIYKTWLKIFIYQSVVVIVAQLSKHYLVWNLLVLMISNIFVIN